MNEQGLVTKRETDWARLANLCDRADANLARLSTDEFREFVRLYRRASTDLALIRTKSTNVPLMDSLNDLVGRAYGILYRAPKAPFWQSICRGLATAAQTVRRRKVFVFASLSLFVAGIVGSVVLLNTSPNTREFFIPSGFEQAFTEWKEGKFPHRGADESFGATGMYLSNNPLVAIKAGAMGAGSFGIWSTLSLLQNGAMVGALGHEVAPVGKLDFMLSSIVPHGVPEISGMIMSGAAGLLLGFALINPGRRTRGASLRAVGPDAITLLATSAVLMFIAAPIEGFFSFNPIVPGWLKLTVASISLLAWLAFWTSYAPDAKVEG